MRLSEIFSERKTVSVPVGEGNLSVTYRPGAITPQLLDQIGSLAGIEEGGDDSMAMVNAFSSVASTAVAMVEKAVVEWDLTDDNGNPYPLTTDALRQLPLQFLLTITKAINKDSNPNPTKRKTSADTSSLAA